MREEMVHHTMWRKLLDALPHGHYLAEEDWQRRHRLMLWILGLHRRLGDLVAPETDHIGLQEDIKNLPRDFRKSQKQREMVDF